MGKTSMTLGWLVGRQIVGQRRTQEKQPIAYLYNGVQLPPLPEWDKEIYPYAVIYPYTTISANPVSGYKLRIAETLEYGQNDIGVNGFDLGIGEEYSSPDGSNGWGDRTEEQYTHWFPETSSHIVWTNTDLFYADGNLWFAASDPIPVYE